ncbi:hypothetical protein RUM43_004354 [Polyplax serrata]|uniref:Uncharacterized protein n=1 Tax=Polyplax serrata TaxID=468196 RepID=A0AAN8XPR1_POLSC
MRFQRRDIHRFAAFSMALFGLYIFLKGVNTQEYRVLDDGSLVDASEGNVVRFKHTRAILTFKAGFDVYRSIGYGISSCLLLLDLLLNSGYLTLPALILSAGEIVNDFSDFCLAVVVIGVYLGGYSAAAYGFTYLSLLLLEITVWFGTCKFHETCRITSYENKMLRKRCHEMSQMKKVS